MRIFIRIPQVSFGEYDRQIKRWPENEGKLFHGFKEDISSLVNVKTRDQNKFHAHLIFGEGNKRELQLQRQHGPAFWISLYAGAVCVNPESGAPDIKI